MDATTSTAPHWLDAVPDDERAELSEALGFDIATVPDDDAHLRATASQLLRLHAEASADLCRYTDAQQVEYRKIGERYEKITAPLEQRCKTLWQLLSEIAKHVHYPSGRKSVKLGHGTIGHRALPERYVIADPVALVGWAAANAPDLVRCRWEPDLAELRQYLSPDELAAKVKTQEVLPTKISGYLKQHADAPLPPGVQHEPSVDVFYAEPGV